MNQKKRLFSNRFKNYKILLKIKIRKETVYKNKYHNFRTKNNISNNNKIQPMGRNWSRKNTGRNRYRNLRPEGENKK